MHSFSKTVVSYTKDRSLILVLGCLSLWLAPASAAILSVRNYGAGGNGSSDDTAAIQHAIDSSGFGDTIQFPAGTYKLSNVLNLASNRTYQGSGAVLKRSGIGLLASMPVDSAVNITLDGLTFDGGSVTTNNEAVAARNIRITNCTFQNLSQANNWSEHDAFFSGGINGGVISNNHFYNISDGGRFDSVDRTANAIQIYRPANISITDNVFDTVNEGIGLAFQGSNGPFPGVVVARNTGTHVHRMGIEMQGSNSQGMIVDSNHFTNYLNPYWNTYGMSIVVDGGSGTVVTNNVVDASPGGGDGYGYGIEVSGQGTKVTGNTIRNAFKWGFAIGNAPNATITGNYLCGSDGATIIEYEFAVQSGAYVFNNEISPTCGATPPPPSGGQLASGTYVITDKTPSNLSLDGGSYYSSKLAALEVYPESNASPLQEWSLTRSGGGYTICSGGKGDCLSESANTVIIGSAQKDIWILTQSSDGYSISNARTGNFMSAPTVSNGVVTTVTIASLNLLNHTPTIWSIHPPASKAVPTAGPLASGAYAVTDSSSSRLALDGGFFYYSKMTALEVYPEVIANPLQQWNFTISGDGYTICSVGNSGGPCLSESGSTLIIGSTQKDIWIVAQSGAGYTLRNALTGNYINDPLVSQGVVRTSTTSTIWSIHPPR